MSNPPIDYKELTARIYALFAAGDIPAVVKLCARDVIWTSYGPQGMPFVNTFKGQAGVQDYFNLNGGVFNVSEFTPGPMYGDQNIVVVTGYEVGTMTKGGQRFRNDWSHVWTYQGSQVGQFSEYLCNILY